MKKWLLAIGLALTLVAAGPAAAQAATVNGVVVAKNSLRKAVVVVASNGSARTVAVPSWKSVRLGAKVSANARALADGSFSARALRTHGRVRQARLRAVVVRYERSAGRYIVSAGGSVFAFRSSGGRALAAAVDAPATQPGSQVVTTLDVTSATPQAQQVTQVGQVGKLSIEGIILELSAGSMKLVVPQVGFVTVTVPAGIDISRFKVFDQVRASVSVGSDGSFTLLSLTGKGGLGSGGGRADDDDDDDDDDDSDDSEDDESQDSDDSDD